MRLELDEISVGGVAREYSSPVENFPELVTHAESASFDFVSPLMFRLRLQRAGTLVELDGQLEFRVKEVCGRCLASFGERIESSFALTFVPPQESVPELEERELETEELGMLTYDGEHIDLHDPLQEQVLISLPISPLCKDECLGLCPDCGVNLNETHCGCEKKLFNNKFAALKNLKIDS